MDNVEKVIKINNLNKKLGNFSLKNINLEIPKGYICGLIGPNGSGKTSLIKVLLNLYRPDDGYVEIDNMTYCDGNSEHKIKENIGVVLHDELFSSYETLKSAAERYGKYYKNYDSELLNKLLDRFELKPEMKYSKISKGQKLKFQLAFAIAHKPDILLLDEPTANFDPQFRNEFIKIVKDFISDGQHSVILVSHLTDELDYIADYIIYLDNGSVVMADDIENIRNRYRLITGEKYKINLLDKRRVIYTEDGEMNTKALVEHYANVNYDVELKVNIPTLEEIMYYYVMKNRG